ncbi:MAG: DUF6817 domain-containing protein [Candidatus Binataceae bacterium]
MCIAGLFHGVYGTESYRFRCATLGHRERIRQVIGDKPEYLVYLFCVGRRPFFTEISSLRPLLYDRSRGEYALISPEDLRDLLEIEAANWVDLMPRYRMHREVLEKFSAGIESAKNVLSPGAYQSITEVMRKKRHERPTIARSLAHTLIKRSSLLREIVTSLRFLAARRTL